MRSLFLELFIALRYTRGHSKTVIFNLGTRLSFFFMALFVFIMVLVLSVFNGFQEEVHSSLWNSGYHVTIQRSTPGAAITNHDKVVDAIQNDEGLKPFIRSVFPSISVNGLLEIQNRFEGKAIRALPVYSEDLESGNLRDFPKIVHYNRDLLAKLKGGNYVIVGREMARHYDWHVGDRVTIYVPQGGELTRGMQIRQEDFIIAGLFRTGYYEFDLNLIFVSLETAQRALLMPGRSTEVIVQLNDLGDLDRVRSRIHGVLPAEGVFFSIRTIKDERGNFLAALQLEKNLMIIILGLLILAGVAGIWVTVHLLVKSKSKSIGMLRAMGISSKSVVVMFTAHSMFIGFLSTAVGGSLGIFIANRLESIIQLFEDFSNALCALFSDSCNPIQIIPRNIYYFDHLPVYADPALIFGVALCTLILSGIAGYVPARTAARLDPVQTIRGE